MKKIIIAVLCAVAVICVSVCFNSKSYSRTEYMLNTVISITADNKKAVAECFEEIQRIENLMSVYIPTSEISSINSAPAGTPVKISDEVYSLLKSANEYKALTDGAFDITIKPVSDLWAVASGGYVPTDHELASAVNKVGDIVFDDSDNTVTLPVQGMAIDLGGIAKGYAGDKVREILIENRVKSAIADLGGNIVAIGKKGKKDWVIGLQSPQETRGSTFAKINVSDKVVVTSGGYERFFEKDGQVYHHIFNPKTGKNPDNGILSITIVAENGFLADALSTACFVAGKDKAIEIANKYGADIVIYTKEDIYYSDGIRNGGIYK